MNLLMEPIYGVGIFIHFGVIDTPYERGLLVIDGVTSGGIDLLASGKPGVEDGGK